MPTLIDAVLAKGVVMKATGGIQAMTDSIRDREEVVCPVPSEFPLVLGIVFKGEPDEVINISTEVHSHMNQPLWFDSGKLQVPASGKGEFVINIPIPVRDVGPCYVKLNFNSQQVWTQRVFFARV